MLLKPNAEEAVFFPTRSCYKVHFAGAQLCSHLWCGLRVRCWGGRGSPCMSSSGRRTLISTRIAKPLAQTSCRETYQTSLSAWLPHGSPSVRKPVICLPIKLLPSCPVNGTASYPVGQERYQKGNYSWLFQFQVQMVMKCHQVFPPNLFISSHHLHYCPPSNTFISYLVYCLSLPPN